MEEVQAVMSLASADATAEVRVSRHAIAVVRPHFSGGRDWGPSIGLGTEEERRILTVCGGRKVPVETEMTQGGVVGGYDDGMVERRNG